MGSSLDQRLLRILRDRAPRAVHAGELLSRSGLGRERFDEVLEILERLRDDGRATEMPGKRYRFARDTPRPQPKEHAPRASHDRDERAPRKPQTHAHAPRHAPSSRPERDFRPRESAPPEQSTSIVRGVLMLHARGFGFLTPDDGRTEVHIAPQDVGPALHGDRVEVEARYGFRGREGRVVGIIERRRPRLIGTLHGDFARSLVFSPGDPRLPETMRILPPVPADVAVGDAVVAEIRSYPQSREDVATVVITERLGQPGDVGVEVERILARDGVVEPFPAEALAEASRIPDHVTEAEAEGRRDLRHVPLATIDPDDARDHDDALYAEQLADGGFRVFIAIADVSHYVRPGTAIDAEALARCTSIYLPSRAIPMLPREISSKMASLLPGEDRLCMGVEVLIGPHGHIRHHEFFEGVMRSRARISYGGAARALGLSEEPRRQSEADEQLPSLRALLAVSKVMRHKRERRGSIDFDLPEAKIALGDEGQPIDVVESRRDPGVREAYRMVEEMMLLANELVAEHLTKLALPAIHRIHPPPDEKRIETFCELAQSLGHDLDVEDAREPKALAQFIAKTADSKEAPFLRFLLLRAMAQASYSIDDSIGHFGLAATHYLHFTSPIRRYPDLAVHRVLRAWLRKEPIDRAALLPKLRMQAAESSRLERRAMTVERDVVKVHEVAVMRERLGDVYEGSISSVDTDLITVRLDSPFVDVTLELARFTSARYELDKLGLRLSSRSGHTFAAGDRMRVEVVDANMGMRRTFGVPARDVPEVAAPRAKRVDPDAARETRLDKRDSTHEKRGPKSPDASKSRHESSAKGEPTRATEAARKTSVGAHRAPVVHEPAKKASSGAHRTTTAHEPAKKTSAGAQRATNAHEPAKKTSAGAQRAATVHEPAKRTSAGTQRAATVHEPAKKASSGAHRNAPMQQPAKRPSSGARRDEPLQEPARKRSAGTHHDGPLHAPAPEPRAVAPAKKAAKKHSAKKTDDPARRAPAQKRSSPHGKAADSGVDPKKARRKPARES